MFARELLHVVGSNKTSEGDKHTEGKTKVSVS